MQQLASMLVVQDPNQPVLCKEDRAQMLLAVLGEHVLSCAMTYALCEQQP